jgi:Mg-chelatase subunit ChlD
MLEGEEAAQAVAEASRKTTSRRDLQQNPNFESVSPEVGVLDEDAFDQLLDLEPDAALSLLAELTGATDERLRSLAQRLAAQVLIRFAQRGAAPRRGISRLKVQRGSQPLNPDDLWSSGWVRDSTSVCLLIDRSGSMLGDRLTTAAVAAAAVLLGTQASTSVVAFSDTGVVLHPQGPSTEPEGVVTQLLRLRGHGTTDLSNALRVAQEQLLRAPAGHHLTLLLSDCRVTSGGSAATAAASLKHLMILPPAEDSADAEEFARQVGAPCVPVASPSDVPRAITQALDMFR